MARTIKVVYENGVFRPLVPVYLDEGQVLDMYLSYEPHRFTAEEKAQSIRELHEAFAELSDEEWAEIEANILGPTRMAARLKKEEEP